MKNIFLILFLIPTASFSQVYSNKEVGKKNAVLVDSLKNSEYPYILPILGDKAHKAGFTLPYSAGISVQYIWQESEVIIDNLNVGFNGGEMIDVGNVVRLENTVTTLNGVNIRPDFWLFPFLNVYGVLAKGQPATNTNASIYLPDPDGNYEKVVSIGVFSKNSSTSIGFGLTPTIGVGGGFMALDMNFTWTDIPSLNKPAFAFVVGPRFGKSFKWFKNPESNISFWVGAFRLSLNSGTNGNYALADVINTDGLQAKVDAGMAALNDRYVQINSWWNNLTELEQNNPVNKAKYAAANKALDTAGRLLNGLEEGITKIEGTTINYSMDKRPKDKWNFIVGTQYQINKHIMLRGEYGFLGSRTQFIGGAQYRFGL